MSFLAPLFDLAQDEVVKEKAVEAAKQFFANSNITINLLPALIAGALLLLLGLPLLALLFQPAADTSATGYGPPAEEYGAPSSSYGSAYSRSVRILCPMISSILGFNYLYWGILVRLV